MCVMNEGVSERKAPKRIKLFISVLLLFNTERKWDGMHFLTYKIYNTFLSVLNNIQTILSKKSQTDPNGTQDKICLQCKIMTPKNTMDNNQNIEGQLPVCFSVFGRE